MAQSIPSPEVIELGKKLVQEFSKGDSIHATMRWMAHYLAEQMDKTADIVDPIEKKAAEKECTDLILKLWKNREYFPGEVRPLSNLDAAIKVLAALDNEDSDIPVWNKYRNLESESPWGNFVQELRWNADHMIKIIIYLVVAQDTLHREKEWLRFPNLISESERELISGLDRLVKGYSDVTISIGNHGKSPKKATSSNSRLMSAFDKIEDLLNEQLVLLAKIKSQNQPPSKKDVNKAKKSNNS